MDTSREKSWRIDGAATRAGFAISIEQVLFELIRDQPNLTHITTRRAIYSLSKLKDIMVTVSVKK